MGVCVDNVLASVRGVVDLSPHETLDEAQDFLIRQGYSVSYRTSTTLTVKRQVSENTPGQESIFKLIVLVLPQSGGGVRIKVRGDDREAVRDHQAAWLEWSESLPKRKTEQPEAAPTMESVTRETVGQEAPRPTTAADNDMPQRRYCSYCGYELSEDARFCSNCGRPVHQPARVPTPEVEVPVSPAPQQQEAGGQPLEQAIRKLQGPFIAPRGVPIGVSYERAIEELDQFFALDFQTNRQCILRYYDDGIKAIEPVKPSAVALILHLVLTFVTFGLWIIVWIVISAVDRAHRQNVRVRLRVEENQAITAELSGSDSWVQTTEAYIRRNLNGER
jgi:zinc-ribbon domain